MKASDQLLQQTAEETTALVGHRYGRHAGEVARDGLSVAGDVKQMTDMFGKKAVTSLAAKATLYTARGLIEGTVGDGSQNAASVAASGKRPAK
mmetsp:Transcript_55567/g.165211  ORF Transcript_55567/g.165211 Transcript_55567/m.165211 type:complete len:93 (+) Transcript_55567:257-535(+)